MKYVAVCKALYDYDAQESEEVSMKEGDVVYVVDNSDPSWLEVQLKMPSVNQIGPVGLVPANYVEEVQPIGTVRAEYAYEAQQDEEVSFEEDEVMTLYEKDDADWYLVQLKSGIIGLAPSNYTKEEDSNEVQRDRNERRVEEEAYEPLQPASPSVSVANSPSAVTDDAKTWSVQEYNPEKKKKKKGKGTLTVGNSMISYESETDKLAPLQQYHVLDISKYLLDNKNVHIEVINDRPTVLDFQAASKSEAKAILVKITDSRTAAAKYENSQRPESTHNEPAVTDSVDVPQSFSCEPKWGIVLYSFEADGGNELSVREHDQVLITDYSSSEEWWHIETSDQRSGIVPSSYLQFHEDYEAALAKDNGQDEVDKRQQEEKKRKAEQESRKLEERRRKQQEEEAAAREYEEAKRAEEANRRRQDKERRRQEEERRRQEEERRKQEEVRQREIDRKKKAERAASKQEVSLPNPAKVRWWTDRSGAFKVEAQFLSASGGKYRLHKVNGVKIDVPEDKLCVDDVEFVRNLLSKQRGEKSHSKPSSNNASSSSKGTATPSKQYNQDWDWFDWFMMIGIPMQQALVYSSAFKSDKLDDSDLPKLTHKQMKTLGLQENHVRRIERYIENEHVEPPSGDENENEEEDEQLARRVKEAEASGTAPNIFRRKSKSSDSSGISRPTPATSAPSKVQGDIFDLLTGEPVAEESELQPASPNATGNSFMAATSPVKEVTSPKGSQDGFDDDAWIPRTVQAIKTGTYKPKNPPPVQQPNPTSGSQQSMPAQLPAQVTNSTGQSQNYQPQQQQSQLQPQQTVFQQSQPVQQQQSGFQQPVQQSFTGYQQQQNQGVNAPQLTGVQQTIGLQQPVGLQQEYQQPQSTAQFAQYAQQGTGPQQQYQQPHTQQFVPQSASTMQFQQQQTTGIPVQTQFMPQQPTNLQYQQQQPHMAMSNPSQFVPQQLTGLTGMQLQQQQQMQMQNQQPIQQNFSQPLQTATVPLSNILPPPLVPQSTNTFGGGVQPQQTGSRSWQTATAQNPFGSPTPAPLAPQLTGVQFSTPSPETFAGNHHMNAISPQYTGMNAQQSGFGNTFNGNMNNRGLGQQNGFQQPYTATNGFNQPNSFGRGW